jgi:hypothetical protein
MDKTFTRAGTSVLNGVKAYRFANDLNREKVLVKNGHTDIVFLELGEAMTKEQAIQFLNSKEIWAETDKVTDKLAKGKVAVKAAAKRIRAERAAKEADVVDDDGFVEPKDEKIQVAMSRKARMYPGLSAQQLYEMVMLDFRAFPEDGEPNF